jgi:hypothetical protein
MTREGVELRSLPVVRRPRLRCSIPSCARDCIQLFSPYAYSVPLFHMRGFQPISRLRGRESRVGVASAAPHIYERPPLLVPRRSSRSGCEELAGVVTESTGQCSGRSLQAAGLGWGCRARGMLSPWLLRWPHRVRWVRRGVLEVRWSRKPLRCRCWEVADKWEGGTTSG